MTNQGKKPLPVFTIGHSTRTLDSFIRILNAHGVTLLVDIRTVPRSRHNPQFNKETLPEALELAGISYIHVTGLGGLRHPQPDSPNTGWNNESFRGFADYMQTPEFAANLEELMRLSRLGQTAIMCAEAVPWRCHRSLIADALAVRGVPVEHLISETHRQPHKLTSWAKVDGELVTYPPAQS